MHCGGVAFLDRGPPSSYGPLGVAGPYATAAQRHQQHGVVAGVGDLSRQAVAQNLLVILNEVENRLQEEMAAVEGFSSTLQDKMGAALPTAKAGAGRRAFRCGAQTGRNKTKTQTGRRGAWRLG